MTTRTARILKAVAATTLAIALPAQAFAECYEQGPLPTVRRSYLYRNIEEPGVYEVTRRPSQYGWTSRRVIKPGAVVWHHEPAEYRTVTTRVKVGGGWSWEKRWVQGKYILCRVRRPVTYETVEKRVLVKPDRRWAERTPSAVGYVHDRILLRPYRNVAHFYRPSVRYSRENLVVQPEGYRWLPTSLRPDC
jgi:hypothetical protein